MIVLDQATNQQYRFDMPGPQLFEGEWQQCLQMIEENDSRYIVVEWEFAARRSGLIFLREFQKWLKNKRGN